jgi:hypothetical protein
MVVIDWGIVLGAAGIVATAAFGVWAINDAREQVRGFIRTERNLAWARIQNDLVWLFVEPTARSHSKEIATGLSVFAILAKELNPEQTPENLKEAAENEALEMAEKLVAGGYASWKPSLDKQRVSQKLKEWKAEKDKVRSAINRQGNGGNGEA